MLFRVRSIPRGATAVEEALVEATSLDAARAQVAGAGQTILSIDVSTPSQWGNGAKSFDVAWWCRELRTLLMAGMSVVEAIETLAAVTHDSVRNRVHSQLLDALMQGQPLSRAMDGAGVFPQVLVAGVIASERTSTLVAALDDYLRFDELVSRLRRQALSAAIYPAVVVGLGMAITLFLLLFVIPRFSRMYSDRQGGLSLATEGILWISRLLQQHWHWVAVLIVSAVLLAAYAFQRGWALRALSAAVDHNHWLREQVAHFRLAKLYQSLALMVRGGYTVDEALAVGQALDLGARMRGQLTMARADIGRGRQASAALSNAGLTEVVTERLLAVGERTGSFGSVLQTIADRHAERFSTFVERATRIVEPLLLLIVALVVGGIVVMMYMPIFDMANHLGSRR